MTDTQLDDYVTSKQPGAPHFFNFRNAESCNVHLQTRLLFVYVWLVQESFLGEEISLEIGPTEKP